MENVQMVFIKNLMDNGFDPMRGSGAFGTTEKTKGGWGSSTSQGIWGGHSSDLWENNPNKTTFQQSRCMCISRVKKGITQRWRGSGV